MQFESGSSFRNEFRWTNLEHCDGGGVDEGVSDCEKSILEKWLGTIELIQ